MTALRAFLLLNVCYCAIPRMEGSEVDKSVMDEIARNATVESLEDDLRVLTELLDKAADAVNRGQTAALGALRDQFNVALGRCKLYATNLKADNNRLRELRTSPRVVTVPRAGDPQTVLNVQAFNVEPLSRDPGDPEDNMHFAANVTIYVASLHEAHEVLGRLI